MLALVAAVWGTDRADWGFTGFLTIATIPLLLLLPVLGVLLVSGEFSQRTALTTLALVPSRHRFVVSKLLAAVVLTLGDRDGVRPDRCGDGGGRRRGTRHLVVGGARGLLQTAVGLVVWLLVGAAFGRAFQNTPAAVVTYLVLPSSGRGWARPRVVRDPADGGRGCSTGTSPNGRPPGMIRY